MKLLSLVSLLILLVSCMKVTPKSKYKNNPVQSIQLDYFNYPEQVTIDSSYVLFEGQLIPLSRFEVPSNYYNRNIKKVQNVRFRDLLLTENGKIFTWGSDTRLVIDDLYSNKGFISTFPIGSTAPLGFNGESGGKIHLTIRQGMGSLNILLKGQDGGQGFASPDPGTHLDGKSSKFPDIKFQQTVVDTIEMGSRYKTVRTQECNCFKENCIRINNLNTFMPTSGQTGNKGLKGMNGGNSGSILISSSSKKIEIIISKLPGLGGIGGSGSRGGRNGVVVNWDYNKSVCGFNMVRPQPFANNGSIGDTGENGIVE